MDYYKIVRVEDGKLYSLFATSNSVRVLYTPNEWASAQIEGTPLFFLANRDDAFRIFGNFKDLPTELWQAKVSNPRYVERVLASAQDAKDILSFWSESFFDGVAISQMPYEYVCDKVMLTKKLQ